jgi:hypothetical protein
MVVVILGPRAGRCGASELAGGDVEEGSENTKTASFNIQPSAGLVTCYRSNSDSASIVRIMAKGSLDLIFISNDSGVGYPGGCRSEY